MPKLSVLSHSLATTHELAAGLGRHLRPGDALCLEGDLGAGKTAFVAGLVASLGGADVVTSPTFTLENRYHIDDGGITEVIHCDLYRTGDDARRDLLPSMLEAREEGGLLAVEWADPVKGYLQPYLQLTLEVLDAATRRLSLEAVPEGWPHFGALSHTWRSLSAEAGT